MAKLTDQIGALPQDATYFSLEFFPPKTQQGFDNLHARLARMAQALRPLFVNVTWGAGGSTWSKSLALAELTQRQLGLTTCLHLTCTNMSRRLIDETLEKAKEMGVRNILALRGDPPRSDEYRDDSTSEVNVDDSNADFTWAVDLVRYIRKTYGNYFCIGVAGYPEGHSDQSHPDRQSVDYDIPYLVEKTRGGADFIMTQLFYDVEAYEMYESRLRNHESGAFKTIPIIPGLMPIQSYQILKRTTKLSHASVPNSILKQLDAVKGNDEAVKAVGVDVLSGIVRRIQAAKTPVPRGFHFYTLNLEKVVTTVLERCGLMPSLGQSCVGLDEHAIVQHESDGFVVVDNCTTPQRKSSVISSQPHHGGIVKSDQRLASNIPSGPRSAIAASEIEAGAERDAVKHRVHTVAICEGESELAREATWDDYPNGRWGDARSPAYGEIDGYGVSLHIGVSEAKKLWGVPTTLADISRCFRQHLTGQIESIPWSEGALQPETLTIKSELQQLVDRGWWTVASQPAVSGVASTDKIFGWGPSNGVVFQKPFVEFFLPSTDWKRLKPILKGNEQITYFAGNAAGDIETSHEHSIHPVTWGAFAGKEIITPTIIEAVSFKAWLEEAFGIWVEWQRLYNHGSETSRLLERVRRDYWLLTVIHHGYLEKDALWNVLLGA